MQAKGAAAGRLAALGLALPPPMPAVASYVPFTLAAQAGGCHWLHIAGQGPFENRQLRFLGRVGQDLSLADGQASARLVALNVLAQAGAATAALYGQIELDRLRCLRLGCFAQCTAGFGPLGDIFAPASQLMIDVLGGNGRHARTDAGMGALPMATSVEIDALFEVF